MKASPSYITRWFAIINLSLPYAINAFGDRMYFPTKIDVACRMAKDPSCDGAFFTRIATTCGHQGQGKSRRKKKVGSSLGNVCKRNGDCRVKKSICYRGVCLCDPGFYFSPKQNACLRACGEYGDGIDVYKEVSITDHNDKIVYNTTLTTCGDLCVREKAFTCLTADWHYHGKCHLSKSGYRDVRFSHRERNVTNYILVQRRCK